MSNSSNKSRRQGRSKQTEQQAVDRLYRTIHVEKRTLKRWVAASELTLSTGAGGLLALTTVANAASVSATPDFASLATLYTAYRVHAIRVQLFPFYPVTTYSAAGVIVQPVVVAYFPWMANNVPTTFAQAQDVSGVKFVPGYKGAIVTTSFRGDTDAHLWTPTSSAIGSGEQFGISCIGSATAATANNPVHKALVDYLVEFRMTG